MTRPFAPNSLLTMSQPRAFHDLSNSPDSSWSDKDLVDYLRKRPGATVSDLAGVAGVTATAIRQRLARLLDQGLVARQSRIEGRGRPTHEYRLTTAGVQSAGHNYKALAQALWDEVRSMSDPGVRRGLLSRLAGRLAEIAMPEIEGNSLSERMASLAGYMQLRGMPFEASRAIPSPSATDPEGSLPVLTALACPYPDLAERDRSVCAMEKMVFASMLGSDLKLTSCRLDGASCCTFEASGGTAPLGDSASSLLD